MLIQILLVLGVIVTVFCLALAFLKRFGQTKNTTRRRLSALTDQAAHEPFFKKQKEKKSLLSKLLGKENPKILERISDELYIAGIALKADEFLAIWGVLAIVLPVIARILEVHLIVVIALVIIGTSLPVVFVLNAKSKSMKVFDKQLLDALTILCNSLRAGFSFQSAMDNIANEMPDPISREFRRVVRECHLGMSLDESLNRLVERTKNEDLELIVSAVLIQRQVGGNLAEVLDNISGTIQQRIKLRGDIKVLTSSGTMSGYIVGLMPVVMMVGLMLLNPDYVESFFSTSLGRSLIVLAVIMEAIGFYFVRKIVNIKF